MIILLTIVSSTVLFQTQQADTRKPAFRWLGQAKRKQENNTMVALPTARPNKRAFGTDLTNFDNKRGRLDSTTENKVKLMQGAGNIVKTFDRQLGQGNRNDFVYGPFHPSVAKKQESDDHTVRQKERKTIQDWENLAVSFRPQYQNQGELSISFPYDSCLIILVRRNKTALPKCPASSCFVLFFSQLTRQAFSLAL